MLLNDFLDQSVKANESYLYNYNYAPTWKIPYIILATYFAKLNDVIVLCKDKDPEVKLSLLQNEIHAFNDFCATMKISQYALATAYDEYFRTLFTENQIEYRWEDVIAERSFTLIALEAMCDNVGKLNPPNCETAALAYIKQHLAIESISYVGIPVLFTLDLLIKNKASININHSEYRLFDNYEIADLQDLKTTLDIFNPNTAINNKLNTLHYNLVDLNAFISLEQMNAKFQHIVSGLIMLSSGNITNEPKEIHTDNSAYELTLQWTFQPPSNTTLATPFFCIKQPKQ
jgi:hypothetical protein